MGLYLIRCVWFNCNSTFKMNLIKYLLSTKVIRLESIDLDNDTFFLFLSTTLLFFISIESQLSLASRLTAMTSRHFEKSIDKIANQRNYLDSFNFDLIESANKLRKICGWKSFSSILKSRLLLSMKGKLEKQKLMVKIVWRRVNSSILACEITSVYQRHKFFFRREYRKKWNEMNGVRVKSEQLIVSFANT